MYHFNIVAKFTLAISIHKYILVCCVSMCHSKEFLYSCSLKSYINLIFVPFCNYCNKNGCSDRFENFFAFAEHVPLRAELPYQAVKVSDFENKIRKHKFFVKNVLEFFENFLILYYLNKFTLEREVLRTQRTLKNSIPIIRTEDITAKSFFLLNCLFNYVIVYWGFSIKKYVLYSIQLF